MINPHLYDFLSLCVNNQQAVLERLGDVDILVSDVESGRPDAVLGGDALIFGAHFFLSEEIIKGSLVALVHDM